MSTTVVQVVDVVRQVVGVAVDQTQTVVSGEVVRWIDTTTAAALAAHEADTTGVHGIADTSALVVDTDARLTDARTPTAHKSSHATGGSDALSPSDIGAVAVSNLSGQIVPGAGFYVQTPIYASATLSAFTLTEAWQFFTPIFVVRTLTIDRLGISVSDAGSAGSVIRLGIYANSAADNPGALLQDASTVDSTTTGDKLAVVSQTLSPGIYWLSCALQGAATTKAKAYGGFFNVSGWTATMGSNACHVYRRLTGGVTGALGSNPSAGSLDSAGSGPRLVARVA